MAGNNQMTTDNSCPDCGFNNCICYQWFTDEHDRFWTAWIRKMTIGNDC